MIFFGTAALATTTLSGSIDVVFFIVMAVMIVGATGGWNTNSNGLSSSAQLQRTRPLTTNVSSAVMLSTWPPAVAVGRDPFSTAIFDGTLLWLIPRSASHLVYIDPGNGDNMTAVALPQAATDPAFKFCGAVYDGEGTIWIPPLTSGYFMTIDVAARTAAVLTDATLNGSASYAGYAGAAFDGDHVWCAPYESNTLLRIDRRQRKGTTILSAPFMGATVPNYFTAAIFDGVRVWFAPSQAPNVLAIDAMTLNATSLTSWPAGVWRTGTQNFIGGCFDGARVWLAPDHALAVAYVDVAAMVILSLPLPTITAMGTNHAFCTAFFDGSRVWLMPVQADSFVAIDAHGTGPTLTWAAYGTAVTSGRGGGASDGQHFYIAPFTSGSPTAVMKLPLGGTMTDSETASGSTSFSMGRTPTMTPSIALTATPSMTSPTISSTMPSVTSSASVGHGSWTASPATSPSRSGGASSTRATPTSFTASQPSASAPRTDGSITGSLRSSTRVTYAPS